ncbi:hypothetical protein [Skermania piniformis]|uniref:Uncharacterized protein n=1 Tax=Skermania pinensis TaxID=39122 RepID=A0ABX8SC11_9ACTN|nr:hypothetical protein [Skermania piniformis]QXQ14981.1 hypothetical protein KV203_06355 [Skermania piniformis]
MRSLPFKEVRPGFDPGEVRRRVSRAETELRAAENDRDKAAERSRALKVELDQVRAEIDSLRAKVMRMATRRVDTDGMSERVARMLQLAHEEAEEVRAGARVDTSDQITVAEKRAAELRTEAEEKLADAVSKREGIDSDYDSTLERARAEAIGLIEAAHAEADAVRSRAKADREAAERDFEAALSARRVELTEEHDELEAQFTTAARRRLESAEAEAARMLHDANSRADAELSQANEFYDKSRVLRGRIIAQLLGIRGQLDAVKAASGPAIWEDEILGNPDETAPVGVSEAAAG